MNAENFWDLVQYDDNADTRLKANQYWFGNKISDKAQPQQRSKNEEAPDH